MRPNRILLAEDNPAFRVLLAAALGRDGHEVVQAEDGSALLEELGSSMGPRGRPFDMVISDVQMPGWSGLDVLAGLSRNYTNGPGVILITAFGDEALHARARRLGALAVFDKPFDVNELRALVARLLIPAA